MAVRTIYKLLSRVEWEAAQAAGIYSGSAHDLRDGYIHFSTAAQLARTARKYFSGVPDLVLLAVDVDILSTSPSLCPSPQREKGQGEGGPKLRWEPARGGDLFPHLYGDLPLSAIRSVTPILLDKDGIPLLPEDLPA